MNDFTTDFTWMIKHFCYSVDDLNKQESENGNTKKKVAVKILKCSRLTSLGRNDNIPWLTGLTVELVKHVSVPVWFEAEYELINTSHFHWRLVFCLDRWRWTVLHKDIISNCQKEIIPFKATWHHTRLSLKTLHNNSALNYVQSTTAARIK